MPVNKETPAGRCTVNRRRPEGFCFVRPWRHGPYTAPQSAWPVPRRRQLHCASFVPTVLPSPYIFLNSVPSSPRRSTLQTVSVSSRPHPATQGLSNKLPWQIRQNRLSARTEFYPVTSSLIFPPENVIFRLAGIYLYRRLSHSKLKK